MNFLNYTIFKVFSDFYDVMGSYIIIHSFDVADVNNIFVYWSKIKEYLGDKNINYYPSLLLWAYNFKCFIVWVRSF